MRCEIARELLREHLDDQLPSVEARAVEAHLNTCAACREEWGLLRQVDGALTTLPVLEEPVDFTARVMAQVRLREANTAPGFVTVRSLRKITYPEWLTTVFRWEDAVVSFAFAWVMAVILFVLALLDPGEVSRIRSFLQQVGWDWLPELDRLWHTVQTEPIYAIWGLSCLCLAIVAAASAILLVRWWMGRLVLVSHPLS